MLHKIIPIRDELNKVSPSFCIAKWQQVTLHLHTGHTHSCHHPKTHKIPIDELKTNPGALHNTSYKKLQRKQMLEGVRPEECDYCWKVEDSGYLAISDRVYKSSEEWAWPYLEQIKTNGWDYDVVPSYVEVSFSNVCNFKCSYCSPQVSSKWMEEVEKYGPYPTSTKFGDVNWIAKQDAMPIPHREENPYVEAFWKWWPSVYQKLSNFRITGGEPLMSKDTFKVLEYVIENPAPNLSLSINTNLVVPDSLLNKFIDQLKHISINNKVKSISIFTSCDAYGAQAEYIRNGMDYAVWLKNMNRILDEVPNCPITVMSTYNALSVFSYQLFLDDMLALKEKYSRSQNSYVLVDVPYLRWPAHQSVFILPKDVLEKIRHQVEFMESNLEDASTNPYKGFFPYEAAKFRRIYEMLTKQENISQITTEQKDFVLFVDEHDRRRGTNFLETFPEMADLYHKWKSEI